MTNDIAIRFCDEYLARNIADIDKEFLKKAKEALQQEPCDKCVYSTSEGCQYDEITESIPPFETSDDAISRQAAIDAIYARYIGGKEAVAKAPANDQYAEGIDEAVCAVEDLPPVTPQPRVGHSFPKEATNKDIFKAIFGYEPATDSVVCNKEDWCGASEPCNYCTSNSDNIGKEEDWWNAPYKKADSEGKE